MHNDLYQRISETNLLCETLIGAICSIDRNMGKVESKFELTIHQKLEKILAFLNKLYQEVIDPELTSRNLDHQSALHKLDEFGKVFGKKAEKLDFLVKSCIFLKFNNTVDTSILGQIDFSLKYRRMLWEMDQSLAELFSQIRFTEVRKLKIDELELVPGLERT